MSWQLIKTAPKDGSSILLSKTGKWVMEGCWWDAWYADDRNQGWMPANVDEEYGRYVDPTHWQPLPEPPK